jgi:hypothetical protein
MADLLAEQNNPNVHILEKQNTKPNHMNKLLLFALLLVTGLSRTQTIIEYDYMETSGPVYIFAGWWTPAPTAGWFTNASVTPTTSAVIYGSGTGTSPIEQDWYVLPNVTGLNPTRSYQLKFRLASYTFSSPAATTRGNDVADFVDVQVSTDGEITYISELRITGNGNAQWPYTATGVVTHTGNGVFTNSAAPAGDVYQAPAGITTTGPTFITLNLPAGITQVAVDILCRVNAAGEEWWLDNIELIEIIPLPVELIAFEGFNTKDGNVLTWKTATEHNSDYYIVERSITGEFTENDVIGLKSAAGNSQEILSYAFVDNDFEHVINYYRLVQVDTDGQFEIFGPIAINNQQQIKKIVRVLNSAGQEVSESYINLPAGMYIEIYDDGTMKKIIK